jgi:hypothetical protein
MGLKLGKSGIENPGGMYICDIENAETPMSGLTEVMC